MFAGRHCNRDIVETVNDIWNYVDGELNRLYPLPKRIFTHGNMAGSYKCGACLKENTEYVWHQEITQNVTRLTCPECGAVHSEMIKGDDQ